MDHDNKILLEKNGITIRKITAEEYNIEFSVNHKPDVINVNIIDLIYELNPDLFVEIGTENAIVPEPITEPVTEPMSEKTIYILFKHLFTELGIPQYYYYFSIKQVFESKEKNASVFTLTPLEKAFAPANCACIPLKECTIKYIKGHFTIHIELHDIGLINSSTAFFEKMLAMVLYKLLNRLKHFIDNIL
jgi:hypothetical protein